MKKQWMWMVVAVLALAGCHRNDGGVVGVSGVGSGGGTVSISDASVVIAAGTFANPVAVTLEKTSDPTLHAVFQESAAVVGPTAQLDASEYKVRTASSLASASGGMDITVSVPAPIVAAIQAGADVSLVYINRYQSDDDEAGESVDSVESVPAVFDAVKNTLKAPIPVESFSAVPNGSLEAVFKIMVDDGSGATIQAMGTRKHVQAATIPSCTCAAPTVPKLYKNKYYICVTPDSGTSLVSPLSGQLKVIGPYAETAGHTTGFHAGVDLRSAVGTPTKAVRSGYIESALILKNSGQVLIIRHFDDTWSRYLHLVPGSVVNVPKNTNNESVYQWKPSQCATPDYLVSQGDVVAQTGDSGAAASGKPHLHFEYGFSAAVASVNTLNPILNGQASLGSVVLSDAQTQQPLPSTGLNLSAVLKSGDAVDNLKNSRFIHAGVFDSAQQEILVRRKKTQGTSGEVFLPVTAQGTNFQYVPGIGYSNSPVVKVDVTIDDASLLSGIFTSGSSVFPYYPLSGMGLVTSPVGAIFSPNNDLASKAGLKSDGGDFILAASAMPPSSASSASATVHVKVSGRCQS